MENGNGDMEIDRGGIDFMIDNASKLRGQSQLRFLQPVEGKQMQRLDYLGEWPKRTWLQLRIAQLKLEEGERVLEKAPK